MSVPLPHILPMRPFLREMVWGGRRLEQYGKQLPPGAPIGESWELSAYPGMESSVAGGPLCGRTLQSLLEEYGEQLVGAPSWERCEGYFPLLVKLIDAGADLSLQVHPDDAYVRRHGLDRFGKMEAWYLLGAATGRFAAGLKEGVTREVFSRALEQGSVLDTVEFHDASPDQVVFVPPGVVHAAFAGIMIYEIQQSSDVTFRLYDYDRPGADGKPRELHVDRGLEVIAFEEAAPAPLQVETSPREGRTELVRSPRFDLDLHVVGERGGRLAAGDSFLAVTVIEGGPLEYGAGDGCQGSLSLGGTALVPPSCEVDVRAARPTKCLAASPPGGDCQ